MRDERSAATSGEHDGDEVIQVAGLRLRVRMTGDGPPLLLIGGLGNNLDVWEPLAQELDGVKLIRFDAPGMGKSDTPCRPLLMPELATIAKDVLEASGESRATVMGLSFGGAIAQQLAYMYPRSTSRLILCATGPGIGGIPGSPFALTELAIPWRYYSATRLRNVARTIYGGKIARDPSLLERHLAHRLDAPPSVLGYYYQLAALTGWSSLPWLTCLQPETMILAGDSDPVFPIANAYLMASLIPNAHMHVLPKAGHMFISDTAPEVAPLITAFAAGPPTGETPHVNWPIATP